MSSQEKPDLVRGWLYVEDLLGEDEAERVAKLSAEEVRAELRAEGLDPEQVPSAEDFLARAEAKAARRAAVPRLAPVVPLAPTRRASRVPRLPWLVAAGFLLLLGGLAATEGGAIVAWLRQAPEPILPDNEKGPPPTPHELADKLRDEANAACDGKLWGLCGDKLDEATKLDPAGDSEPRVAQMRAAIIENTTFRPERKDRPK